MPSYSADKVIPEIENYISRKLTREELFLTEEMVLNYYSSAIIKFINISNRHELPRCFDFIYASIMSGKLWGAKKNTSKLHLGMTFKTIHDRLDRYLPRIISDREFMAMYTISHQCDENEFEYAFKQAAYRNIFNPSYILAISVRAKNDKFKSADRGIKGEDIAIDSDGIYRRRNHLQRS